MAKVKVQYLLLTSKIEHPHIPKSPKPHCISNCRLKQSTHQKHPKMAIFEGYGDLIHSQNDELSLNKHIGLTIYTKGNLNLVLCLDDPTGMHSKVEKTVSGPNSYFYGYCTPTPS